MKKGDYVWLYSFSMRQGDCGWEKYYVVGDTSRSWIISSRRDVGVDHWDALKLPKNNPAWIVTDKGRGLRSRVVYSDQEKEQFQWVQKHRRRIGDVVSVCEDYVVLKSIADMVRYNDAD